MSVRSWWRCLAAMVASSLLLSAETSPAPPAFEVEKHYTKYEYRIPMRDGVHLFTAVYLPKDGSRRYPFLINRTPYGVGPYGEDHYPSSLGPSEDFESSGYIFVYQDVRGRYLSEGKFVEMTPHLDSKRSKQDVDDSSDLYDTIEWLLNHVPNHNGNAGIWGISYPGFYTAASMINAHPALKAASPQAPIVDLFQGDDAYHGGAFMLAANFGFYTFFLPQQGPQLPPKTDAPFDFGTEDSYDFYLRAGAIGTLSAYLGASSWLWSDQIEHDTYDSYWKIRNLAPHLENVHCAVLTVGGWFDAEDLAGPFKVFHAVEKNDPGIFNALVVGPWVHGGWEQYQGRHLGRVGFASDTGDFYRKQILFPFFEQYLKAGADARLPKAYVFETGSNLWRQYTAWPPNDAQSKTLYFGEHGQLSFGPPAEGSEPFDEYLSDPQKPVPFVGYIASDVPQEYMLSDQRFADSRTDVLSYQTQPLEEDMTVAGPISPHLFVSTSGTDSDFDVKLIDVYPADYVEAKSASGKASGEAESQEPVTDVALPSFVMGGYQQLVRGEPFRGKFRHGFEKPEPFVPGRVEEIDFSMPDVNHTFRRGHRVMVQVASSWFPLTDRNPQTFVHIASAKPSDFVKATERVYHTAIQPSGIRLQVLPQRAETGSR